MWFPLSLARIKLFNARRLENILLVDRLGCSLLHLAQEILLVGDLGQVHPLAFLHPGHVSRRELRQGDPTTTTVSRVALKWSFYHAGRFSALYRSQFGELPGQTLRRVRPSRHFVLEDLIDTETAATA